MKRTGVLLAALLLMTTTLWAEGNKHEPGWYLNASLGLTANPLRFGLDTILYHRIPLVDSDGMLWKSTRLDWGIRNTISPATEYIAAQIKVEPIAVFELTAEVGYFLMYKRLGYGFISFDSLGDAFAANIFDPDVRKAFTETNKITSGALMTTLIPSFRVAFGPLAIVHNLTWQYMEFGAYNVVYDYGNVVLRSGYDSYVMNDTLLILQFGDFRVGAAHHYGYAYGTDMHIQRVMAMGVWTPKVEDVNPYFILQAGVSLQDPFYQDQFYMAVKVGVNLKLSK